MARVIAVAAVLMLAGLPGLALAQVPEAPVRETAAEAPAVDVSKLPLNVSRIQREMRKTIEREELDGKVLRYNIDVFGQTPSIQLFAPDVDLRFGPVPYSAPTHREMMDFVTPQEFRSPVMNFGGNLLDLFGSKPKNDQNKKK